MPAKPRIYIETSVVSYLTAKPSRDDYTRLCQQRTAEWWQTGLPQYEPVITQIVRDEAARGDPQAAAKRLTALEGIALLDISDDIMTLAAELIVQGGIPEKAKDDAIHIAASAVHRILYMVRWNFRHIANAATWERLKSICKQCACPFPEIFPPIYL
ncbi:MAG: type II toxin-antitoxin system VapC family toxin [Puniceicoccales bacterium]|nr:type II toxin-antitoxin system VapC family toxin [Puniceicoccales bacterium]